jgi:nitrite reductase/ring-hydroxylating ferredoxin subunit
VTEPRTHWHRIADSADLEEEDVVEAEVDGVVIAAYRLADGTVHATSGICSHEYARLCEGLVLGGQIECPKHQGRFDVRDGRATASPASTGLETFPARDDGSAVYVALPCRSAAS